MARTIYKARLASVAHLTPTVRELKLELVEPLAFQFQAGQFVTLHTPQQGESKPVLRAYSLASDHHDTKRFTLLIKLVSDGKASSFISLLQGGEEINFTGPFGKVLFRNPPAHQVIFVCTGVGLSQHMSFLLSHGPHFPQTKFRMVLGVWNEGERIYQKVLDGLKTRIKDFHYDYVIDSPSPSWKGLKGYVTDHLEQFDYMNTDTHFYICGNPHMVKAVKSYLTETKKFDASRVFVESFG